MKTIFKRHVSVSLIVCVLSTGCSKLIDIDPPISSISSQNVFESEGSIIALMNGVYSGMSNSNKNAFKDNAFISNVNFFTGLMADELVLYDLNSSPLNRSFYHNSYSPSDFLDLWNTEYNNIYICNSVIEGLSTDKYKVSASVRQQILGEAFFMRAFIYFYLVNLYGNTPLALTTDYIVNSHLLRAPVADVYTQIEKDLKEAESLLSKEYLNGSLQTGGERVRPTKWAAAALLARTFLYEKKYQQAIEEASKIIEETNRFRLPAPKDAFLKETEEAIFQLQNVNNSQANTGEGNFFVILTGPNTNGDYPVYLSDTVVHAFEHDDQRLKYWVKSVDMEGETYHYTYKYKADRNTPDGTSLEYLVIFRLAEQYLIRAEAYAHLGNLAQGKADLDIVRDRAGLPHTTAGSTEALINAILHERQVELFTEGGHRWFDLKRTEMIDMVMPAVCRSKGGQAWSSHLQLLPIQNQQYLINRNLTQNPGY